MDCDIPLIVTYTTSSPVVRITARGIVQSVTILSGMASLTLSDVPVPAFTDVPLTGLQTAPAVIAQADLIVNVAGMGLSPGDYNLFTVLQVLGAADGLVRAVTGVAVLRVRAPESVYVE